MSLIPGSHNVPSTGREPGFFFFGRWHSEQLELFPGVVRVCAWCHPGLRFPSIWQVTHGICPAHLAELRGELGASSVPQVPQAVALELLPQFPDPGRQGAFMVSHD